MEARLSYMKIETQYAFISSTLTKVASVGLITTHIFAALFPISFALFGLPEPEKWKLPVAYM